MVHRRSSSTTTKRTVSGRVIWMLGLPGGCDPSQVHVPRLRHDVEALLRGQSVRHPTDDSLIPPSEILLVEDPFGRTRPDIRQLYDLVLFVDLPADLSVVRMVKRALGFGFNESAAAIEDLSHSDLAERIRAAHGWLTHYAAVRDMYTILAEPVRSTADVILDGRKPPDELCEDALDALREHGHVHG